MNKMRIRMLTAFLLLSVMLCVSKPQPQACGLGFAAFTASDSEGRSIPDLTIELIAEAPEEQYGYLAKKMLDEATPKISKGDSPAIKVTAEEAEEIIELRLPMSRTQDVCLNPLSQQANVTQIIHPYHQKEASTKYFGFCTREGNSRPFLLKISAPGYVTDYYVGPFLGGCHRTYMIVLRRL